MEGDKFYFPIWLYINIHTINMFWFEYFYNSNIRKSEETELLLLKHPITSHTTIKCKRDYVIKKFSATLNKQSFNNLLKLIWTLRPFCTNTSFVFYQNTAFIYSRLNLDNEYNTTKRLVTPNNICNQVSSLNLIWFLYTTLRCNNLGT